MFQRFNEKYLAQNLRTVFILFVLATKFIYISTPQGKGVLSGNESGLNGMGYFSIYQRIMYTYPNII